MTMKIKHNKAHVLYKVLGYNHCSIKTSPITSDEESVPDLVEETTSFSPVIRKVETISVTEYNNMPSEETEGKHVRFQEPPTSPSPQRCEKEEEEEEMEIQEAAPVQ